MTRGPLLRKAHVEQAWMERRKDEVVGGETPAMAALAPEPQLLGPTQKSLLC
jgi:hypothetical protein